MDETLVPTTENTACDLLLRVLDRHCVDRKVIAAEAGIPEGALSRVLSGQQRAPVELFRAAWRMTRDAELLHYLCDAQAVIVSVDRSALPGGVSMPPATTPLAASPRPLSEGRLFFRTHPPLRDARKVDVKA